MNLRTALTGLLVYLMASAQLASAQTVREKLFPGGEFFQFEGHAAFVLLPERPVATGQPWVFYAPTLDAYPDTHEEWMHRQFLAAGVAIAGVDVGEAYGNPESRRVFDRFYQHLIEQRKFSPKPCLLGRSRGGLWVMNWACDHPERFSGLAGIYPVFDFRTYPGIEKAAAAYAMTPAELTDKLQQFNPIQRATAIAKAKLPVFIIHGDEDTVVPLKENSAALEAVYRSQSNDANLVMKLKVVPGQGHNFWEGFFRCQELVDFVIQHARKS